MNEQNDLQQWTTNTATGGLPYVNNSPKQEVSPVWGYLVVGIVTICVMGTIFFTFYTAMMK